MLSIALAADTNFFPGLHLAMASILRHTSADKIHFHVLDGGLSHGDRAKIEELVVAEKGKAALEFHTVDTSLFKGFHQMYGNTLTYARLLLPNILPGLDEVIYCDSDAYYGADLSELGAIPLDGKSAAVVRDPLVKTLGNDCTWLPRSSREHDAPYFNAGVMKINLCYWRERGISGKAMEMAGIDPHKYQYWDQSILNLVLLNTTQWVPAKFNYIVFPEGSIDSGSEECEGKNLHYISTAKPWNRHSRRKTFRYWRACYLREFSKRPPLVFSARYWGMFFWGEIIVASPLKNPVCGFLLKTGVYRLLPSVTETKLLKHLGKGDQ